MTPERLRLARRILMALLAAVTVMLGSDAAIDQAQGATAPAGAPKAAHAYGVQVQPRAGKPGAWRWTRPAWSRKGKMRHSRALSYKRTLRQRDGRVARVRQWPGTHPHLKGDLDCKRTVLDRLERLATRIGRTLLVNFCLRTRAEQQRLWDAGVKRWGYPAVLRWVARPGTSRHETGCAADTVDYTRPWVNARNMTSTVDADARAVGLVFPMSWEPWHLEIQPCVR